MAKCLHFWMVDVTGRGDEQGICGRKKWGGSYCKRLCTCYAASMNAIQNYLKIISRLVT